VPERNEITIKKTGPEAADAAPAKGTGLKKRAEAVEKILSQVEEQLQTGEVKASLGDYIKLIQLSKEMKDESKTEIRVTWIEEPKTLALEE
jgi:hypothetical protein